MPSLAFERDALNELSNEREFMYLTGAFVGIF